MTTQHKILMAGGILAGLAVALGAFGAHALKSLLEEYQRVDTYELAVRYQFYHALALLLFGGIADKVHSKKLGWASLMIVMGVLIFSGSLYILSLTGISSWGAVTPIGGLLLLLGWLFFLLSLVQKKG